MNSYHRSPPRYSVVAASLARDIDEGRYPVGQALPTETELRQQFGVSRHTVREALRELKERGLVTSRSGVGTHVRARPSQQRFMNGVGSIDQLLQIVSSTRQQVLKTREIAASPAQAEFLRCNPGRHWLEIRALRWAPETPLPVGLVTSYIAPEYADIVDQIETASQPIFSLIEQRHGPSVVEIRQEIGAASLTEAQAATLSANPGDIALQILRHHLDAQDNVTQASIGIYPTNRSSYITQFRVQRGA